MASHSRARTAVRISDVAEQAGVSSATVSRVLNENPSVQPDLAERVRAVAEEMGYRPNAVASNLRRRRTSTWALLISDVTDPFFTSIARGVEDVAQDHGYSLLLCNSDEDPEREAGYLSMIERHQVAGLVISPHDESTDVSRLVRAGVPIVAVDRSLGHDSDVVRIDSELGAQTATAHLLEAGWHRPVCVNGSPSVRTARDRADGYRKAMAEAGRDDALVIDGDFRVSHGHAAAQQLLAMTDPPDAVFASNSMIALGLLRAFHEAGVRVGRDVGLIAFDDAPWMAVTKPEISVVAQPAYAIGREAGRVLTERIAEADRDTPPSPPRDILLRTDLIVRESSRRG